MTTPTQHLTSHLTQKHLHPTPSWVTHFLSTQKPSTPLPALKQTALFRLLASDIRSSLSTDEPEKLLPRDVLDAGVRERRLGVEVVVMVCGLEDVGRSKWGQVEGLEEGERGERREGREVVRVVADGGDNVVDVGVGGGGAPSGGGGTGPTGKGTCKLLLCDAAGAQIYGFEMSSVEGVHAGMNIGAKILLRRDLLVARGVLLLEPGVCVVLGGKVEALMKEWGERRKKRLVEAIEDAEGEG